MAGHAHSSSTLSPTTEAHVFASSARVRAKALRLSAEYVGRGRFVVPASDGGEHTVQAPKGERDPRQWTCSCPFGQRGGRLCSHVRAARGELARIEAAAVPA